MTEKTIALLNVLAAGGVERCHAIPHHGSYSVASHSWGVAQLVRHLWPGNMPLLLAALDHDVPELWVGDIPSPAIRALGPDFGTQLEDLENHILSQLGLKRLGDLHPEDRARLLFCDRLQFWLWCQDQADMGNRRAAQCAQTSLSYMRANLPPFGSPMEVAFRAITTARVSNHGDVYKLSHFIGATP